MNCTMLVFFKLLNSGNDIAYVEEGGCINRERRLQID